MHKITLDAWNKHWKRDDPRSSDGLWDDVLPLIDRIPYRPEKAFRPFTLDDWAHHKKGLKVKSARGGVVLVLKNYYVSQTKLSLHFSKFGMLVKMAWNGLQIGSQLG